MTPSKHLQKYTTLIISVLLSSLTKRIPAHHQKGGRIQIHDKFTAQFIFFVHQSLKVKTRFISSRNGCHVFILFIVLLYY